MLNKPIFRIGIIADTHDVLKEEVIRILETCNIILHAGDITTLAILDKLSAIATTIAVCGNNDAGLENKLPKYRDFYIGNYHFYMIHDIKEYRGQRADFVISGHSHKYVIYQEANTLFINPGGCGKRRFSLPLSLCILTIDDTSYKIEKVTI